MWMGSLKLIKNEELRMRGGCKALTTQIVLHKLYYRTLADILSRSSTGIL
jgi:hypothetical protein